MRYSSPRPATWTKAPSAASCEGATAASTASLSMFTVMPPQVSWWPPWYWWMRWWLAQYWSGIAGSPVVAELPFHRANQMSSGWCSAADGAPLSSRIAPSVSELE